MKKNTKGFIGLFAGIAALILICIALFVPTNPISGSAVVLHGQINVILALVAAVSGVAAIVFGVLSRKDADKKGPRKAGVIVGVIAVIIALFTSGLCALTRVVADYANGKEDAVISRMDKSSREKMDEIIQEIRDEYPA